MEDHKNKRIHWSFWLIAVFALIWNVLGSINFLVQINADIIDAYRESERAIIENRPLWATIGFAVAVFGGAIGSVLLILKKSISIYLFIASLIGVIVTMIHALSIDFDFGAGELIGIIFMPIAVALLLIGYSRLAANKGWIR